MLKIDYELKKHNSQGMHAFNSVKAELSKMKSMTNNTSNLDKMKLKKLWLTRVQVRLYGIFGMFKKSVDLALEVEDYTLAKEYANKPASPNAQKTLWLKIIGKMVGTKTGKKLNYQQRFEMVQDAMSIIRGSNTLTIQEVLELFPKQDEKNFSQLDSDEIEKV